MREHKNGDAWCGNVNVSALERQVATLTAERDAALAELARLRKLEAWAKDFIEGTDIRKDLGLVMVSAVVLSGELRKLLTESEGA